MLPLFVLCLLRFASILPGISQNSTGKSRAVGTTGRLVHDQKQATFGRYAPGSGEVAVDGTRRASTQADVREEAGDGAGQNSFTDRRENVFS